MRMSFLEALIRTSIAITIAILINMILEVTSLYLYNQPIPFVVTLAITVFIIHYPDRVLERRKLAARESWKLPEEPTEEDLIVELVKEAPPNKVFHIKKEEQLMGFFGKAGMIELKPKWWRSIHTRTAIAITIPLELMYLQSVTIERKIGADFEPHDPRQTIYIYRNAYDAWPSNPTAKIPKPDLQDPQSTKDFIQAIQNARI